MEKLRLIGSRCPRVIRFSLILTGAYPEHAACTQLCTLMLWDTHSPRVNKLRLHVRGWIHKVTRGEIASMIGFLCPEMFCIPSLVLEGSQHRLKMYRLKMYRSQSPVICWISVIQRCLVMKEGVAVGQCEKKMELPCRSLRLIRCIGLTIQFCLIPPPSLYYTILEQDQKMPFPMSSTHRMTMFDLGKVVCVYVMTTFLGAFFQWFRLIRSFLSVRICVLQSLTNLQNQCSRGRPSKRSTMQTEGRMPE